MCLRQEYALRMSRSRIMALPQPGTWTIAHKRGRRRVCVITGDDPRIEHLQAGLLPKPNRGAIVVWLQEDKFALLKQSWGLHELQIISLEDFLLKD